MPEITMLEFAGALLLIGFFCLGLNVLCDQIGARR